LDSRFFAFFLWKRQFRPRVEKVGLVREGDKTLFLAGDTSYNERLMLAGKVDGVSPSEQVSVATLEGIRKFARTHSTIYLPTHDPQSAARLANHGLVGT
jgi:N-acyl homoserine lactone hydrolase